MRRFSMFLMGLAPLLAFAGSVLADEKQTAQGSARSTQAEKPAEKPVPKNAKLTPPKIEIDSVDTIQVEEAVPEKEAAGEKGEKREPRFIFGTPGKRIFGREFRSAEPAGKYWLGVQCFPADEALQNQLKVSHGLLVAEVAPESPAAKAGVKVHDLLLQAGEAPLREIDDLVQATEETKGKELKLVLIRQGEKVELLATPADRPAAGARGEGVEGPEEEPLAPLNDWIRELERFGPREGMNMFLVRPGVVLGEAWKGLDHPAGLKISIQKTGKEPAKVTVEQGEKKWETTADKLDDLPADIRPHVEQLLGQGLPFQLELPPNVPGPHIRWFRRNEAAPEGEEPGEKKEGAESEKPKRGAEGNVPRFQFRAAPGVPFTPGIPVAPGVPLPENVRELIEQAEQLRKQLQEDDSLKDLRKEIENLRKEVESLKKDK